MRPPGSGPDGRKNKPNHLCDYCSQTFYCRRKKIRHMVMLAELAFFQLKARAIDKKHIDFTCLCIL